MSDDKVLVRGVIVIVADPHLFTVELHVLLSQSLIVPACTLHAH